MLCAIHLISNFNLKNYPVCIPNWNIMASLWKNSASFMNASSAFMKEASKCIMIFESEPISAAFVAQCFRSMNISNRDIEVRKRLSIYLLCKGMQRFTEGSAKDFHWCLQYLIVEINSWWIMRKCKSIPSILLKYYLWYHSLVSVMKEGSK